MGSPALSSCMRALSRSTKRVQSATGALSMGVWELLIPSTTWAIDASPVAVGQGGDGSPGSTSVNQNLISFLHICRNHTRPVGEQRQALRCVNGKASQSTKLKAISITIIHQCPAAAGRNDVEYAPWDVPAEKT